MRTVEALGLWHDNGKALCDYVIHGLVLGKIYFIYLFKPVS